MMNDRAAVMEVARWEFLRYLKPKQQLTGIILTFVLGLVAVGIARMSDRDDAEVRDVVIIGDGTLRVTAQPAGVFRFIPRGAESEDSARAAVAAGDLDALLIIHDIDRAELVIRRRPDWLGEMRGVLSSARRQEMLARTGLDADDLAAVLAPPELDIAYAGGSEREDRVARIALIIVLSLMLMAVFVGMGYIFGSITGEKQIRVTEQVVSAIPAQAWIDGKIVGLIGVSLVGVANTAIAVLALFLVTSRGRIPLPGSFGDPVTILVIIVFAILGLFFWFSFLAAIAAMIDDPNNSTRSSFLFVPILMTALAFMIGGNPDGGFARTLSLVPLTSPSAMPARMISGDVHALEIALSLVLLLAGVWLLRIAAGRVFRLGMLMYGKEPTWGEVRRWMLDRS